MGTVPLRWLVVGDTLIPFKIYENYDRTLAAGSYAVGAVPDGADGQQAGYITRVEGTAQIESSNTFNGFATGNSGANAVMEYSANEAAATLIANDQLWGFNPQSIGGGNSLVCGIGNSSSSSSYTASLISRNFAATMRYNGKFYNDATAIWAAGSVGYWFVDDLILVLHARESYGQWRLRHVVDGSAMLGNSYYARVGFADAAQSSVWGRVAMRDDAGVADLISRTSVGTSVGSTAAAESDFVWYIPNITLPSAGQLEFRFRIQDSNNFWVLYVYAAGSADLIEVIGGSLNYRGVLGGGSIANGEDICIVANSEDGDIKCWLDSALIRYVSTSYENETDFELESLGTGGAVDTSYIYAANYASGGAVSDALKSVAFVPSS